MPTTFEIHPAIGVARVGPSPESFLGPEPGQAPPAQYRDSAGRLLRQAARFRVFSCERDDAGALRSATEVTAEQAHIEWTVHVANRKGAGPESPPSPTKPPQPGRLRNAGHANRAELVIDPGPATVAGPGQRAVFDSGSFLSISVALGEMRTEADGRLVVLGGFGTSGSVSRHGVPAPLPEFANNDDWFDDVSDGPVTARVTVGRGPAVAAKPAWFLTAPPDFAPGVTNLVTLYDIAFQAAVERGWRTAPGQVSFTQHVQPILQRALGYQWVSHLGRQGHGPGAGGDFAARWAALADPTSNSARARQRIFEMLRDPSQAATDGDAGKMPRLHNNDYGDVPGHVLRMTSSQYAVLKHWAAGEFVDDLGQPLDDKELLPDALDRVSLQACSGGPFFPGIEVGEIMADAQAYSEPFRIDAGAQQPGGLTAGNAVPWQADFMDCSVDRQAALGWWPAQRPHQVLTHIDSDRTQYWDRNLHGHQAMVDQWHELGVVVEARRADGTTVFVESERGRVHHEV